MFGLKNMYCILFHWYFWQVILKISLSIWDKVFFVSFLWDSPFSVFETLESPIINLVFFTFLDELDHFTHTHITHIKRIVENHLFFIPASEDTFYTDLHFPNSFLTSPKLFFATWTPQRRTLPGPGPSYLLCQIKNVLSSEQSLKLVIPAQSFRKHKCSIFLFLIFVFIIDNPFNNNHSICRWDGLGKNIQFNSISMRVMLGEHPKLTVCGHSVSILYKLSNRNQDLQ